MHRVEAVSKEEVRQSAHAAQEKETIYYTLPITARTRLKLNSMNSQWESP